MMRIKTQPVTVDILLQSMSADNNGNESSRLISNVPTRSRPTLRSRLSGLLWNRQDHQVSRRNSAVAVDGAIGGKDGGEPGSRRSSEARILTPQKPLSRASSKPVNVDRLEPELHVIGQIAGFKGDLDNAFTAFKIEAGQCWESVGAIEGIHAQTQVDYGNHGYCIWNHPIDGHWFTSAMQGWPRIYFQLFSLDSYGGWQHEGYSVCWIPFSPGHHHLECTVWRPTGTPAEEIASYFLGLNPSLTSTDVLLETAKEERCKLVTISVGTIICELDVLIRNFDYHRIEWQ